MEITKSRIVIKIFISLVFILSACNIGYTQVKQPAIEQLPSIGTTCPDYTFDHVRHYSQDTDKETLSLKTLKGKWIVLDFWTQNCTPCITSFPKLNKFQKKYKDKVQIILVGINDQYNQGIGAYFEGVRQVQKIDLPIALDTILRKKLQVQYAGTLIFINPDGKIEHALVGSDELKGRNFKRIINGKK